MAYTSRKRRARMAEEPMHDNDNPELDGPAPTPAETDAPVAPDSDEKVYAFLPKSFFGGMDVKPGDSPRFDVEAIDPETGEVQVCINKGEGGQREKSMVDMMDEAIPEE